MISLTYQLEKIPPETIPDTDDRSYSYSGRKFVHGQKNNNRIRVIVKFIATFRI